MSDIIVALQQSVTALRAPGGVAGGDARHYAGTRIRPGRRERGRQDDAHQALARTVFRSGRHRARVWQRSRTGPGGGAEPHRLSVGRPGSAGLDARPRVDELHQGLLSAVGRPLCRGLAADVRSAIRARRSARCHAASERGWACWWRWHIGRNCSSWMNRLRAWILGRARIFWRPSCVRLLTKDGPCCSPRICCTKSSAWPTMLRCCIGGDWC